MKIAILGNIPLPIGLDTPAGTEVFTAYLIKGLKEKGHDVTLYATNNNYISKIKGYFTEEDIRNQQQLLSDPQFQKLLYSYQNLLIKDVIVDSSRFDIIHNNYYLTSLVFPFASLFKSPVVHTVHNDLFELSPFASFADLTLTKNDTLVYVSSNAQKKSQVKKINNVCIHNAIDHTQFAFNADGGEAMVWFSRVSPNKGLRETVMATNRLKKPLLILMNTVETRYEDYFEKEVKTRSQDNEIIQFIQKFDTKTKIKLLGNSKLFLFPLQWEEPFGLVLLESMATGTPVVTFARGATSEIVKDGETGYLVNPSDRDARGNWITKKTGLEGIIDAVNHIYSMPPKEYKSMRLACKKHVEMNFSLAKMSQNYENLYRQIINKHA